jgi:hypothetical protein
MSTIVTRSGKGSPLTHTEVDNNFTNLNTDKYQSGDNASFGTLGASGTATLNTLSSSGATITGGSINGTTIGASTASTGSFTSLTDSGNITFTGTGNRIIGDMTNTTIANRILFQSSTTNGNTGFGLIPNGTALTSAFQAFSSSSDPANSSEASLSVTAGVNVSVSSGIRGTGTYLPLTMFTGGAERLRIDTSGNLLLGTTSSAYSAANRTTLEVYGSTDSVIAARSSAGASYIYNSSSGMDLFTTINGYMRFLTNSTERMRIDSSGNVGIGLTPATSLAALQVQSSVANGVGLLVVGETNNERIQIRASQSVGGTAVYAAFASRGNQASPSATLSGDVLGFYQLGGYDGTAWQRSAWITGAATENYSSTNRGSLLAFSTTPNGSTTIAERMRIDSSGNLLVGTTSRLNNALLSVGGTIASSGYGSRTGLGGSFTGNVFNIEWSSSSAKLWIDGSNVGTITLTSDYRIKRNIETQTAPALARVMALRPVTYQMADYGTLFKGSDDVKEGFIAHEVQEVIPSGVEGIKDDENQIQSLRVDAILAVAVKAIQELKAEVDSLKAQLESK